MSDGKDRLQKAMEDAIKSVESRERGETDDSAVELEVESAGAEPAGEVPGEIERMRNELAEATKKAQADVAELKDKWLRSAAELENYKKRSSREREDLLKFANEKVLRDIIPILDDLDRTLEATTAARGEEALGTVLDGLRMVQKKFLTQLEKHGVTTFESAGKAFDPGQHEAVQQVNSESVPAGAVVAEYRRGFFLNGRLLRPAMVTVSLGPQSSAQEADDASGA